MLDIEVNGVVARLLPHRALMLCNDGVLLIADVHLGKAAHFRKSGIALPLSAQTEDYHRLRNLIHEQRPKEVIFLGDLFHSVHNYDWDNFEMLVSLFPEIKFTLVRGNHDIIESFQFQSLGISVVDSMQKRSLLLTHEPLDYIPDGLLNIAGHIHPGVRLSGIGRQSVTLPCFYLYKRCLVLPAFGALTGLYCVEKKPRSEIYLVLTDVVKKLS